MPPGLPPGLPPALPPGWGTGEPLVRGWSAISRLSEISMNTFVTDGGEERQARSNLLP